MRFVTPVVSGLLAMYLVEHYVPHQWWIVIAWGGVCASIGLSVIDVIMWQTVKSLDDYVTRFQGSSAILEEVLKRVSQRKRVMFVLFLVNFFGRGFSATILGGATAGKAHPAAHPYVFAVAVGLIVFSLPILSYQMSSYFRISQELGQQLVRGRKEKEREEELKRRAAQPPPMTATDEHTSGYTKEVPWS